VLGEGADQLCSTAEGTAPRAEGGVGARGGGGGTRVRRRAVEPPRGLGLGPVVVRLVAHGVLGVPPAGVRVGGTEGGGGRDPHVAGRGHGEAAGQLVGRGGGHEIEDGLAAELQPGGQCSHSDLPLLDGCV
jgi:hypothetical protein